MNKCTCYCTGGRILYDHMGFKTYTESYGYCNGTKEREECSCGGDRTKCEFYPEVRERALKEQKLKFGEWISVEDRLPESNSPCLVCKRNSFTGYRWIEVGYYQENKNITHWQPLPELPKGE